MKKLIFIILFTFACGQSENNLNQNPIISCKPGTVFQLNQKIYRCNQDSISYQKDDSANLNECLSESLFLHQSFKSPHADKIKCPDESQQIENFRFQDLKNIEIIGLRSSKGRSIFIDRLFGFWFIEEETKSCDSIKDGSLGVIYSDFRPLNKLEARILKELLNISKAANFCIRSNKLKLVFGKDSYERKFVDINASFGRKFRFYKAKHKNQPNGPIELFFEYRN